MLADSEHDVDNKLIGDVIKSLVKVANAALGVLFEIFVFGVLLVKLVGECPAYYVGEHVLEGELVRVFVG